MIIVPVPSLDWVVLFATFHSIVLPLWIDMNITQAHGCVC